MENAEISEPLLRKKVDLVQHCRLSPLVFSLVLSSAESKVGRITASEEAPSLPGRGWEDSGRDPRLLWEPLRTEEGTFNGRPRAQHAFPKQTFLFVL